MCAILLTPALIDGIFGKRHGSASAILIGSLCVSHRKGAGAEIAVRVRRRIVRVEVEQAVVAVRVVVAADIRRAGGGVRVDVT